MELRTSLSVHAGSFSPLFSLLIGSVTPATNYTDGLVCFTFVRISNLCSEMLTRRFSTCTGVCCAAFRERWDINHGQHSAEFVLNGFSWRVRWVKGAAAVWLKQQKTKCWTVVALRGVSATWHRLLWHFLTFEKEATGGGSAAESTAKGTIQENLTGSRPEPSLYFNDSSGTI